MHKHFRDSHSPAFRGAGWFAGPVGERHQGGRHGGGRFGGGRHGGGRHGGGPRQRAARMFSSADLHWLILALLEERPRHGYDLIKAVDERSAGAYIPSPGMVYPALSYLEELGYISADADGTKKQYRLEAAGLAALDGERVRVAQILAQLQQAGEQLAQAGTGEAAGSPTAGSGAAALALARRELKATLFDGFDAPDEEQRRVAAILIRTIAELRKQ